MNFSQMFVLVIFLISFFSVNVTFGDDEQSYALVAVDKVEAAKYSCSGKAICDAADIKGNYTRKEVDCNADVSTYGDTEKAKGLAAEACCKAQHLGEGWGGNSAVFASNISCTRVNKVSKDK